MAGKPHPPADYRVTGCDCESCQRHRGRPARPYGAPPPPRTPEDGLSTTTPEQGKQISTRKPGQ